MGAASSAPYEDRKVIVVGAGYAGTAVAKELDKLFDVTLIDRRDHMQHAIGQLRAAVVGGEFASSTLIPTDRVLKRGKVLKAAVTSISPETVKLEGGSEIHIRPGRDFLVIATGSTVAAPAQFDGLTREAVAAQHADIKAKIDSARHVLIVGGGPVGVELAGEIRDAHPDKRVTIVHRGRHLCSSKDGGNGDVRLPDSFGASLKDLCEERSIEVRLGVSVPASTSTHEAGADLALSDGTSVAGVDLILWASGAKPNNATFRTTMAASLDEAGRLVTEPSLLVRGSEHVFALGDCAETGASKTAYMVGAQAPVVAGNVKALADGKPATGLKAFTCGTPAMVVPVGAAYGRGVLPFCGGIQIGNSMVSSAKGKTLFLDKTRADLGY